MRLDVVKFLERREILLTAINRNKNIFTFTRVIFYCCLLVLVVAIKASNRALRFLLLILVMTLNEKQYSINDLHVLFMQLTNTYLECVNNAVYTVVKDCGTLD